MAFQFYIADHVYIKFFARNIFETLFNNVAKLFNQIEKKRGKNCILPVNGNFFCQGDLKNKYESHQICYLLLLCTVEEA